MLRRKTGSETSARIASIAGRGLRDPKSLTPNEIREVCGAALEQREPPTTPIKPRRPDWLGALKAPTYPKKKP